MALASLPRSLLFLAVLAGCTPAAPTPAPPPLPLSAARETSESLPPVPEVRGPLALRVIYPAAGATVAVRDSSFLFGSTGTGAARLTINGRPVPVWPNGAWIAWLPFPRDSVMRFRLEASVGAEVARVEHEVRRAPGNARDSLTVLPRGRVWWPANEYLPIVVYGPDGATVRVRLHDGTLIPLTAQAELGALPAAVRAFDIDSAPTTPTLRPGR